MNVPRASRAPVRIHVIYDDGARLQLLEGVPYAHDGHGIYFKARRPGGGTIEIHILSESHFRDHPDAHEELTG